MNCLPDQFTYDLTELNSSVVFIVAKNHNTGKFVKVNQTGALAVFSSMQVFEDYLNISNVLKNSTPYDMNFDEIKAIANQESEGFYQLLY
jgi:hypothetical protein